MHNGKAIVEFRMVERFTELDVYNHILTITVTAVTKLSVTISIGYMLTT